MFSASIGRLIDTFVYQRSSDTCVFDMFYLCSFRSLFTYSPDSVDLTSLLLGNYVEIINLLDLSNMDIILKDNTISYPKDFNFIFKYLIKNIVEDVIDNNFESIVNKTPVAMTYKIKKALQRIPGYATKFYNTINRNLL